MNTNELQAKVAGLENRIDELNKKSKDGWDKFQILSSLLIPLAIAFAGFIVSNSVERA